MQLDSSIDQRLKELEDINQEMQQLRDVSEQEYQMTQQNYYELLAAKMDKSKALFDTVALQQQARLLQEVATNRFRASTNDPEEMRNVMENMRGKNQMVEEVLDKIRNENPDLDVILSKCIGW